MKVSASVIKSWMRCSLQAKYRYIDGLPDKSNAAASFGSAVHLALELYNNTKSLEKAEKCFLYAWDNPAEFDIEPEVWPPRTSYGQYRERGIDFIRNYHEANKWIEKEIVATEFRFCVPIGDHTISGIIDIMEVQDDKLKIVDLKTGYRPNSTNLNHDVQFTTYLYAPTQKEFWCGYPEEIEKYSGFPNGEEMWEKYKDAEITGIWYDLRNSKEYHVGERSEEDYAKLYRCIDEIARAIEFEVFVPDISGDSCSLCSYRGACHLYSPSSLAKDLETE